MGVGALALGALRGWLYGSEVILSRGRMNPCLAGQAELSPRLVPKTLNPT